jgi:nucleoside transporter
MLIAYCALFVPTLALGNSLSLHHLADSQQDFPRIKIWSAIGWIAGGVTVGKLNLAESPNQFLLAGGASILFGLFAFGLPHTPPKKVGQDVSLHDLLGLDALSMLKKPAFGMFILCMFLICIPLYFYFVHMGPFLTQLEWKDWPTKLTLAQISDVIFLFLLPIMLKRLGYKKTIMIGISSWIIRYFLLAASAGAAGGVEWMIFSAILLHGVCYDFLFIAGQLYVDEESDERTRGAAQGFIAIILWGFGSLVGTFLAGSVRDSNKLPSPQGAVENDWATIWSTPAWIAVGVLIVFLIAFKNPTAKSKSE